MILDVLQLIKRDNEFLRQSLSRLNVKVVKADTLTVLHTVQDQVSAISTVDRELLLPELVDAYNRCEHLASENQFAAEKILRLLKKALTGKTAKVTPDVIVELQGLLEEFVVLREDSLMPAIRRYLSTRAREELVDVYEDYRSSEDVEIVGKKNTGRSPRTRSQAASAVG